MWNARLATYILPLGLLIAGCGGGGGGGFDAGNTDTPANGPASGPTTGSPPPATDTSSGGSGSSNSGALSQKTGPCADTYQGNFTLVEGKDKTRPRSGFAKPAKGKTYSDPAYDSCVVRVTDAKAEGLPIFGRNDYSRRQAFNADDSRVLISSRGQLWHLYDVENLKYVRELDLFGSLIEPQWHPTHPDLMYILPDGGGMTIIEYNVVTDEKKTVTNFDNVSSIAGRPGDKSVKDIWPNAARVWTREEGAPSTDGRYWAMIVETRDSKGLGMITYDMLADEITGVFDFATDGGGVAAPDHISMSPSGEYVVPAWANAQSCPDYNRLGTQNKPCGMMSYSRDFSYGVGLTLRSAHADIGVDKNGRDVIVAPDYDTGWVEMWDLATGENTKLWQIYINGNGTAMHVSARNSYKPGWVLISTYKGKGTDWFTTKIMAVEMTANPRILNIAHTYNSGGGYFSETHASVNRDFTKIVFNSNWNTSNDNNIDTYMIELPKSAVPE